MKTEKPGRIDLQVPAASPERFRLNPSARVWVAGLEVALPTKAEAPGNSLRCIAPKPAQKAATAIAQSILDDAPFCVTDAIFAEEHEASGWFHSCTSGSTGVPKRIRRSQKSWIASFSQTKERWRVTDADRTAILGDLSHSLSLYALIEALHLGTQVELLAGTRPDRQAEFLARATLLYATPSQMRALLPHLRDLPAMRFVAIGGGRLDDELRRALATLAPQAKLEEFYGAAETSFVSLADADAPKGSVGRAFPGAEIRIRDGLGNDLGSSAEGVVWVKSPYLAEQVIGQTVSITTDGWATAGELGWLDAAGYLYLTGRRDRMFTVSDRNLNPEKIESFILQQPGVEQVAILSQVDPRRGFVPVGFFIGPAEPEHLVASCRREFGATFAPRSLFRLEQWPMVSGGKTDLQALARMVKDRT